MHSRWQLFTNDAIFAHMPTDMGVCFSTGGVLPLFIAALTDGYTGWL